LCVNENYKHLHLINWLQYLLRIAETKIGEFLQVPGGAHLVKDVVVSLVSGLGKNERVRKTAVHIRSLKVKNRLFQTSQKLGGLLFEQLYFEFSI
jgi:hypothetical protein